MEFPQLQFIDCFVARNIHETGRLVKIRQLCCIVRRKKEMENHICKIRGLLDLKGLERTDEIEENNRIQPKIYQFSALVKSVQHFLKKTYYLLESRRNAT